MKWKTYFFYFKCRAGQYTLRIDDYVKPNTRLTRQSSDQDVLIPKCRQSSFNLFTLTVLLNSGIRYLNPPLIGLNLTHVNADSATFRTNYDVTHFNAWKSISCKCSRSRNLLLAGNCCYWDFFSAAGVIHSHRFWNRIFILLIMFKSDGQEISTIEWQDMKNRFPSLFINSF